MQPSQYRDVRAVSFVEPTERREDDHSDLDTRTNGDLASRQSAPFLAGKMPTVAQLYAYMTWRPQKPTTPLPLPQTTFCEVDIVNTGRCKTQAALDDVLDLERRLGAGVRLQTFATVCNAPYVRMDPSKTVFGRLLHADSSMFVMWRKHHKVHAATFPFFVTEEIVHHLSEIGTLWYDRLRMRVQNSAFTGKALNASVDYTSGANVTFVPVNMMGKCPRTVVMLMAIIHSIPVIVCTDNNIYRMQDMPSSINAPKNNPPVFISGTKRPFFSGEHACLNTLPIVIDPRLSPYMTRPATYMWASVTNAVAGGGWYGKTGWFHLHRDLHAGLHFSTFRADFAQDPVANVPGQTFVVHSLIFIDGCFAALTQSGDLFRLKQYVKVR